MKQIRVLKYFLNKTALRVLATSSLFVVALLLTAPLLQAAALPYDGIPFKADVQRYHPKYPNQTQTGKMYVGPLGIRSELEHNGRMRILIYIPSRKTAWVLLTDQKKYVQNEGVETGRPPLPHEAQSSCQTSQAYSCHKIGTQRIHGRITHKWEVAIARANQAPEKMYLWIDPRLKIAIREEYADGLRVELTNIREGNLSSSLFALPKGYSPMAPSADTRGSRK